MAYTASDMGTARPCWAARRTTKPCKASSSMRRPATRSSCREEKLPASAACANAMARSWAAGGTGLPSASATAHTSATRLLKAAQAAATVRISPIGRRTAAVMPACAQIKASLAHSTVLMLADRSASKPASSQQASKRRALGLSCPSSSPIVMLAGPPVCRITPGSAILAKMNAAPPITWSSPIARASFSSLSTPFCSEMTAVPPPTSGLNRAAAASVSKVLTQKSTKSHGPTSAGSSVAGTLAAKSPLTLRTISPWSRIPCRWGPRAMKCTSAPAWASRPPKYPPTPPAPYTAMRMLHHPVYPAAAIGAVRSSLTHYSSLWPAGRGARGSLHEDRTTVENAEMAAGYQQGDSPRKRELLEAAYGYALANGLADFSLRPLARAIGSSPRVLLFLFGSKDGLVRALLSRARDDELAFLARARGTQEAGLPGVVHATWQWLATEQVRPLLTLWAEAYVRSLVEPGGSWSG